MVLAECGLSSQDGYCIASSDVTIAALWHSVIFVSMMA